MLEKDRQALIKAGYDIIPLVLNDYEHDHSLLLREFIYNFLETYNREFDTVDKHGRLQTPAGRYRSLGNIFLIAYSYYANITLEQVKTILESFTDLVGHICGDIDRRIYALKKNEPTWSLCNIDDMDEFNEFLDNTSSNYIFSMYD